VERPPPTATGPPGIYKCWTEIEETVPILCVRGDLDVFAWKRFPEEAARLLRQDARYAVVELTGVTYLDMHAVREFERLATVFQGRGGLLVIADPSPVVRCVLEIVEIDTEVLFAGSREAALSVIGRHLRGGGNLRSP
jgi:anti-anti-sigma factor